MYSHTITRLAYWPIFFIMFASGICTGSMIGLLCALIDRGGIGIFGGTLIALFGGLISGLVGLIYTAVFNTLAPALGGMTLKTKALPVTSPDNMDLQSPDSLVH